MKYFIGLNAAAPIIKLLLDSEVDPYAEVNSGISTFESIHTLEVPDYISSERKPQLLGLFEQYAPGTSIHAPGAYVKGADE